MGRGTGSRSRRLRAVLVAAVAMTTGGALLGAGPAEAVPTAAPVTTPTASTTATPRVTATPRAGTSPAPSAKPVTGTTATPVPTPTPTATATPAPQPVGQALAADVVGTAVLTLPAADGLRDSTRIRIRSGSSGAVDLLAISGRTVVHLADGVPLARVTTGWARSVRVPVTALKPGTWTIRVRRTAAPAVRARLAAPLVVGSGKPVHVFLRPAVRTLYPWRDGVLDDAVVSVSATDETGSPIPVTGTVEVQAARLHRSRPLTVLGGADVPVVGLPLGPAVLRTQVTGPAGKPVVRTSALTLAPTGVRTAKLSRSSDTIQPVVDGLLDSVVLTTSGAAAVSSPAPVSGTLTVSLGTTVVQRWAVPDGAPRTFTWDGRTKGAIVPGVYTATLSLHGPEGVVAVRTKPLLVTKDHLPYRVQNLFTVAAGNQQGLAVHDGVFYVGYDDGDGNGRIEEYDGSGKHVGTLGPLAIGHAAELSYSTTTGLLYAANGGGSNLTMVWSIDPATGQIRDTFDLTGLGSNGMVAVDDANQRLLVFAGSPGNYSVTPVGLTQATTTAADGTTVSTPQVGTAVPIAITGVPQGVEVVGGQLWVYTSLKRFNHLARYDLGSVAALSGGADLMNEGEGEGLAIDLPGGPVYVGTHSVNRVSQLVPVTDE